MLGAIAAAAFARWQWKKPRTVFVDIPDGELVRYQLAHLPRTPPEKRV